MEKADPHHAFCRVFPASVGMTEGDGQYRQQQTFAVSEIT